MSISNIVAASGCSSVGVVVGLVVGDWRAVRGRDATGWRAEP
jgi:hypothetical protein